MKLWLLSQTQENGWDTFDRAVVAADTESLAKETFPYQIEHGTHGMSNAQLWAKYAGHEWCSSPYLVTAKYLAEYDGPAGVILASFNAG